ncbi:MAG: 2-oxo acid dehydrogenase subunit E2, partial [Verrucomicrobiota bacterium]
ERYDLYQYKKYSDVRLVFAPESAIALFGGAAADYTFQRYSLDVAFLRAYENGKPAATPQYLKWSTEGVTDTALGFAAGNPAPTSRLATVAQLTFYHDTMLPAMRGRIQWRLLDLRNFAAKSEANLAIATRHVGDLNTSYKFTAGRLIGNKIVHPSSIDVGFAVEAEEGVLVPVIRNAEQRLLKDLVERYDELIKLAHQRKLPADATGGSIATVTNFGTFGLTWATPIPLPEQTLVLGMGAARRVPNWDAAKSQFVPVMEANVTLSFDHRVLDGGAAGRLLARVAQLLASPEKL